MGKHINIIAVTALVTTSFISTAGASSTKSTAQNPIPISLPVSPIGQITFDNITQHITEISAAAYSAVQKVEAANSQPSVPMTIKVGPTTVPSVSDVPAAFKKIQKLWSGFRQPKTYYALVYNFQDKAWALTTDSKVPIVASNGGSKGPYSMSQAISKCSAAQCSAGNSGIRNPAGNGYGQFGMDPAHIAQDPFFTLGGIFGHEYTHSAQAAQFLGNKNLMKSPTQAQRAHGVDNSPSGLYEAAVPCWWAEGQANFLGTAATSSTLAGYISWRTNMAKGHPIPSFTDYSAASLLKALNDGTNPFSCLPPAPTYELGYGIGALVIEALAAIGGPQSTMAVVTLMGRGQTYAQAFKSVYGISWASAVPILAQVAAAGYAATPNH
jgi:hypothetical protein